ncbi:MAG: glycosyltransferase [Bacteroidota bacterium]
MITPLFIATALYAIVVFVLTIGAYRACYSPRREPRVARNYEPTVSVVVAARNEERHIAQALESILKSDYPQEKLEVIIIDDRSTDATPKIIKNFAARFPNLHPVTIEREDGKLRGKVNALAHGIPKAQGEIIMLTDADCTVSRSWIRETVKYFTSDVGIVAGLTLLNDRSWFAGMQALDWLYLLSVAASTINLRVPLTVIGNNLSFRKASYDATGGFENIPFSVTEDQALFKAIIHQTTWDYRFPLDGGCVVNSEPCTTWSELYRQKHRWGIGGLDIKPAGFFLMSVGFTLHALLLASPFYAPALFPVILALFVKFAADLVLLTPALRTYKKFKLLKYFLPFELYYIVYVVALPFALLFGGKVVWKGRRY